MMSLLSFIIAPLMATTVFAAPTIVPRAPEVASIGTGTSGGFFYNFWSDRTGPVAYNNLDGGRYTVKWDSGSGSFFAGKGWKAAQADDLKTVTYNGTWSTTGNGYLSLYGWTLNPKVEYYILENHGSYDPSTSADKKGSIATDDGVYDIYRKQPIVLQDGRILQQVWSIRREKRTGGTITLSTHFDAWKEQAGLKLGKHEFAILATEGYYSQGQADISVKGGSSV